MAKRIYFETVKSWALKAGIPAGIAGFTILFMYLNFLGVINVTGYSGDMICAGTLDDPCIALINFTVKEDIFIYPVEYDPYGRDTPFSTDKGLSSWKIYRSWGTTWREIDLSKTCIATWCGAPPNAPDNKYSFAFREGRDYQIKIVAYKNNSHEDIKWGFGPVDPFWYGTPIIDYTTNVSEIDIELGSQVNITANLTGYSGQVCVDIDHPSYGNNYSCGTPSANFLFNISYFRNNEFNDTSTLQNISWDMGGNQTLYMKQHQRDDIINASINITGYFTNDTYPRDVKIYINNTISNLIGDIFTGNILLINLNDSSLNKTLEYNAAGTQIVYLSIPKMALVSNATINLSHGYFINNYTMYKGSGGWDAGGVTSTAKTGLQIIVGDNSINITGLTSESSTGETRYYIGTTSGGSEVGTGSLTNGAVSGLNLQLSASTIYYITTDQLGVSREVRIDSTNITFPSNFTGFQVSQSVGPSNPTTWWYNIRNISYFIQKYPINVSLEAGVVDGIREWNYTGEFNITNNQTINFNTSINEYLVGCTSDANGRCDIPLYLISQSNGSLEISDIQINYSGYNPNPVFLNTGLISSFLGNRTGFSDIPIKIESTQNGTLQIDDVRLDYAGGNETVLVTSYQENNESNNQTMKVNVFYSSFYKNLPYTWTDKIFFMPRTSNSKNVSAYGQTPTIPIFNITTTNYGGRNMDIYVRLNETYSCLNISATVDGTTATSAQDININLQNGTLYNLTYTPLSFNVTRKNLTWLRFESDDIIDYDYVSGSGRRLASFSLSLWFRSNSSSINNDLWKDYCIGELSIFNQTTLRIIIENATGNDYFYNLTAPTGEFNDSTWRHVAVVFNHTDIGQKIFNITAYIDGINVLSTTDRTKDGTITCISSEYFGGSTTNGRYIDLDEIRFYYDGQATSTSVLSPAQVLEINNSGRQANTSLTYTGLYFYYPLNENDGNDSYDIYGKINSTLTEITGNVNTPAWMNDGINISLTTNDYALNGRTFNIKNLDYSWARINLQYSSILNMSWLKFQSNVEYLNNSKIWMWADLNNCNASESRSLRPEIQIESSCVDCPWDG